MTVFSELAVEAALIAEASGNDAGKISTEELGTMLAHLQYAVLVSNALLTQRFGGDEERARSELSRALDLPPRVRGRRVAEAERILSLGGMPNLPQCAAHVAHAMETVAAIEAVLEQRRSGAGLQ